MGINSNYWNGIVDAFNRGPEQGVLNITKTESGLLAFSAYEQTADSGDSANLFEELLGKNRLKRICGRVKIDINKNSPLFLSRENVHKIFIGMMDIKKEDIDELEGSVADRYKQLMLFDNFAQFEKSFIKDSPNINAFKVDKVKTSGKGFQGLTERISLLAHHHFTLIAEENKKSNDYRDVEMLTSRLADREIQKGAVVHLHDGYFYVDDVFIGGGAYVAVLRDFEKQNPPKIVCRGTAMRKTATDGWKSGLNDLLLEIGSLGVKSIWPDLSIYLKNNNINEVEVLGKSLGGAHAQELAILIEGVLEITVKKLTTFCSVGVGKQINQLFKDEVLSKRTTPFNIQVIRNGGNGPENGVDYIPAVGGVHLGAGTDDNKCEIEVTYINTSKEIETYPLKSGILHRAKRFINSFGVPHSRQTTLKDFHWTKIEDRDDINKHLKVGNQLETIRKIFAWIINFLTLFILNGKNFKSYYKNAI